MSYEKLGFTSGQTLKAEHLNHMEDGIANVGGVTSWNELEDKPFGAVVEKQDIISNVNVTFTNGQTGVMDATVHDLIRNSSTKFIEGEFYQISINGVNYDCVGEHKNPNPTNTGIWLSPVGSHNVRIEISMMTSFYTVFAPVSDGVHNISISTKPCEVIKPLDQKYMPTITSPNGKKFKLAVDDDGTVSATEVTD